MKTLLNRFFIASVLSTTLLIAPFTAKNAFAGPDPFVGEVMWVGFNFCPRGFASAEGQLLPISSNQSLFSLLGNTYGGDGRTTFALPDLRGRSIISSGQGPGLTNIKQGMKGGSENFQLSKNQLPPHTHTASLKASNSNANAATPENNFLGNGSRTDLYQTTATPQVELNTASVSVGSTGGGQAVLKRSPYIALKACIALTGIYPSRS